MNDNSIMPYGKYKGEKMCNVPASYLLWLWENHKCCQLVKMYIEENMDVLKIEVRKNSK